MSGTKTKGDMIEKEKRTKTCSTGGVSRAPKDLACAQSWKSLAFSFLSTTPPKILVSLFNNAAITEINHGAETPAAVVGPDVADC